MRNQGHRSETDALDPGVTLIGDKLEMLVTSDPVAELDHALADAATCLRGAKTDGDAVRAQRILAWIDHRLDERLAFQYEMGAADRWRGA
jgi:hypothetical protein